MGMKAGAMGEVDMSKSKPLAEPPSFYARRNCWYGASFPSPADVSGRDYVGVDRILWGNDYPHYEGCYPIRARTCAWPMPTWTRPKYA